jgi:hypothetical protein
MTLSPFPSPILGEGAGVRVVLNIIKKEYHNENSRFFKFHG